MPVTPYAKILVSVNGGATTSGGLTVANGDAIQLSAESTVGWTQQLWSIYSFYSTSEFPLPSGWTDAGNGVYVYTGVTPPPFTLPAGPAWGKWLLRLTVNGGLLNGAVVASLKDESTALSIPSPNAALVDLAYQESNQFSATKKWVSGHQANLRQIDLAVAGAALVFGPAPPAVAAVSSSGSASTPSRSDHTHAHGSQAGGSLHADVIASGASGFMTGADKAILDAASAVPSGGVIVKFGSSADLAAVFFAASGSASVPTVGSFRAPNNVAALTTLDSIGGDTELIKLDNTDLFTIGDASHVANATVKINTSGVFRVEIGGSPALVVTSSSVSPSGNKITNLGTPTANADAATKLYVDTINGYAYVAITYSMVVAAASPAQTTMFINLDNTTTTINGGPGAPCPTGAVALGSRYQLNTRFSAPGATLIQMSIGVPGSFKQWVNVPVDSTSPTPSVPYGSFGGDDYFADVAAQFFQIKLEISGADLTQLTAGDLVVRCAYVVPTLS